MAREVAPRTDKGELRISRDSAFYHFIKRSFEQNRSKFNYRKYYSRQFWIDEQSLDQLENRSNLCLKRVGNHDVEFSGAVGFEDESERKFDNLRNLLDFGTNEKRPCSLDLRWSVFSLDANGLPIAGSVQVFFGTESYIDENMRMYVDAPRRHSARVYVEVEGVREDWVSLSFKEVSPFVEDVTYTGLLKPLRYLYDSSNVFGVLLVLFLLPVLLSMFTLWGETSLLGDMKAVQAEANISQKIDLLAAMVADEKARRGPNVFTWFVTAGGVAVFLALIGSRIVPRVSPQAVIALGLEGKRIKKNYYLWSRFFAIIILPVLLGILSSYIFYLVMK